MGHHHEHHPPAGSRIGVAFALNATFTLIELVGGWLTNSTAIMADAIHDLGDTFAIGVSWYLQKFSQREADARYSYGYRRFSLLGAVLTAAVLIAGSILILVEAVPRLWAPQMPVVEGMLALAVLGIVVNGMAAWRLSHGQSLNEKVLNLHFLEDVLGWVAVLLVSLVLWFFPLPVLDPLLSIGFTLFILWRVSQTLRQAMGVFLQSVPDATMLKDITQRLRALEHVSETHHVHLWSLDGEEHVLTAHVEVNQNLAADALVALKCRMENALADFPLAHTTIEIEMPDESCRDAQHAPRSG